MSKHYNRSVEAAATGGHGHGHGRHSGHGAHRHTQRHHDVERDLHGGAGRDRLRGGRGDDTLDGGAGDDRLWGGRGDDLLDGGAGNDRLHGGRGADTLDGGAGDDHLLGGSGDDRLIYTLAENQGGTDLYDGQRGHDTLRLNLTADEYLEHRDELIALDDWTAEGHRGHDTFETSFGLSVRGIEGVEVNIEGIGVVDPSAFELKTAPEVHLESTTAETFEDRSVTLTGISVEDPDTVNMTVHLQGRAIQPGPFVYGEVEVNDIPDGVHMWRSTQFPEQLSLSGPPDLINEALASGVVVTPPDDFAGQFSFFVIGSDGKEQDAQVIHIAVEADADAPTLEASLGAHTAIMPEIADDAIVGTDGLDDIRTYDTGAEGNETIYGLGDNDRIYSGNGDDTLVGGDGDDTLIGYDQRDQFHDGNDVADGGAGDDTIVLGQGENFAYGGDGDDHIHGAGIDALVGGAGDDTIEGNVHGSQTVVFSGARADYDITVDKWGTVYTIADTVDGRDGTDTARAVEFFQFSDGVYAVSDILDPDAQPVAEAWAPTESGLISPDTVLGHVFDLDIQAGLTDLDGSESLSIAISGLPGGATLSAGADNGDGTWTLAPEDLAGLQLTTDGSVENDFSLIITATSTEANGDTASTQTALDIPVDWEAEAPELSMGYMRGTEDQTIALDISAGLTDTDGSETLGLVLSDLPDGAMLSAGTDNGDGTWTLAPGDLEGLTLTPPANLAGDLGIKVSAVSHETQGGDEASYTRYAYIRVEPVADSPELSVNVTYATGDTLPPAGDGDTIWGSLGDDHLVGANGNDVIDGSDGNDYIVGGGGGDTLLGGDGNDSLFSEDGNDIVDGGAGDDVISVGAGNDRAYGGDGNDRLYAGGGDDHLIGGAGDDYLEGNSLGPETAVFQGTRSEYEFTWDEWGQNLTITDTVEGRDGTDTARFVENYQFSDGTYTAADVANPEAQPFTAAIVPTESGLETPEPPPASLTFGIDIKASLVDQDGSEHLSGITVEGVPDGGHLSAGHDYGNGKWYLSQSELNDLSVTVPSDAVDDTTLKVSASSYEMDSWDTAVRTVEINLGDVAIEDPRGELPGFITAPGGSDFQPLQPVEGSWSDAVELEDIPPPDDLVITEDLMHIAMPTPDADINGGFDALVTYDAPSDDTILPEVPDLNDPSLY